MTRFVGKLLLFALLLLSVKWLLVELTDPLNSSPDSLSQKKRLLTEQKAQTNTLFIGSSRTYTSLIPSYFDSLTKQTNSLNLGVSNFYMPHTADLCQQVLGRPDLPIRYILFELSLPSVNVDPFQGRPLANADFYWQYWSASLGDSTVSKISDLSNLLNEYIYNLFSPLGQWHILKVKWILLGEKVARLKAKYWPTPVSKQPPSMSQPPANKPAPNNQRLAQDAADLATFSNGYITSHRQLSQPSPGLLAARQRESQVYQTGILPINSAYVFYTEKLRVLQQAAAQRGVRVLFFLPNRLTPEEATVLIPIFRQLAPAQRLVIEHDARFDQLFEPRFSMDKGHLNDDGARIFTKLLTEAFCQQVGLSR